MFFVRCYFHVLSSPRGAGTIFLPFYRHRATREQYFRVLSSPRGAETISLPFYRRRAAREQYLCHFIVAVRRGNNIFAILSSPCGAGTIFSRFSACSITASIKIFVFTFSERRCVLENGRGGACVPAQTSAQRRFHTKNTRIVRGEFNDGCAPAGRLGRAHRHRPYQTPSYPFAPFH